MPSTDQKRIWFPEVVVNHKDRGKAGYLPICDTSKAIRLPFPREGGGSYNLLIHPKTKEAWEAYTQLMRHYGETVPSAGGTHNCRNIAGTNWPSLHAYCLALDLPPNSRKGAGFQAAVLKIKTKTGVTVFKNLASINDRMHDEIDCSPAALASGINWATVPGGDPTPEPPEEDVVILRVGASGNHIGLWKKALNTVARKFNWDPAQYPTLTGLTFDTQMKTHVTQYQNAAGVVGLVPELGALDDYTRDLLVEYTRDDG